MSVLITGGAGYVGSFVADRFAKGGLSPVILDDLSTGHFANTLGHDFIEGFISDGDLVRDVCKSYHVNTIVHLAGLSVAPESIDEEKAYLEADYFDTVRLAMAGYDCGVDRFIFASTASANSPSTSRGKAKYLAERFLLERFEGCANLRLFNVAGATPYRGEDRLVETHLIPNLVNMFFDKKPIILRRGLPKVDGGCWRDYVHVLDVAEAFWKAYEYLDGGYSGSTFDVGTGTCVSTEQVANAVMERIIGAGAEPCEIEWVEPSTPRELYKLCADSLYWVPGWHPMRDLKEIIYSVALHESGRTR